jgi:Transposase DDE domain group 1
MQAVTTIGLDIAKSVFQIHGVDAAGNVIVRRQLKRRTRLSCRTFAANFVRLQLHALAYNLGNFLRTLATPEPIKDWSLTSLKDKLIKIGAKVVSHGRYVVFQMAEVAIPRQIFQEILRLIAELRPQPPPAPA